MGIFDSIKNAFGGGEEDKDTTTGPSQLLREAGIDPGGLKFGFGTGTIAVSGTIADESERAKIMEVLSGIAGIEWLESLGADVVTSSLGYYYWYEYADLDGDTALCTIAADLAVEELDRDRVVAALQGQNPGLPLHPDQLEDVG